MPIDITEFTPYIIGLLRSMQAAQIRQISWTTVYDGDELETCNISGILDDGRGLSNLPNYFSMEASLLALAKQNDDGETGSWILDLANRKLYRTHDARRRIELVETRLIQPEETDLSGLDLRTQAERDY